MSSKDVGVDLSICPTMSIFALGICDVGEEGGVSI